MSPQAVAAIYGGLVGGVLAMIGVLAGMFLESRLQRHGKLRCVVSNWELTEVTPLGQAFCTFEVYLFNESILATGLRDISIAFYQDSESELVCSLKDRPSAQSFRVLDLPPRRWVHARPYALFEADEAQRLIDFRRVEVVGRFPDGSIFRQMVVSREDYVVTRSRPVGSRMDYAARPWRHRMFGGL